MVILNIPNNWPNWADGVFGILNIKDNFKENIFDIANIGILIWAEEN